MTEYRNEELGCSVPVAVYLKKEDADAALSRSKEAEEKLKLLEAEFLDPYRPAEGTDLTWRYESEAEWGDSQYCWPASDGRWYTSKEAAVFADILMTFEAREDVKALKSKYTKEKTWRTIIVHP